MRNMRKRDSLFSALLVAVAVFCFLLVGASPGGALEGGGSHYYGGGEDFGAGSWPSHGLSLNLTILNFNWDRNKDSHGRTEPAPGGLQVDGMSNSFKIMYTTNINILGATLGWFISPSLVYQHISAGGRTESKTEPGDLNFGVVLKQDFKDFSHVIGSDIFAPTGSYDKDDVNNIGVNYWTFGPTYAFTYVGGKDSFLPGFEASARMAYYFHTTNHATNYTSGQEFSVDYLVGQRLGSRGQYRIGVNGHFAWQMTDDSWRDAPPNFDGHKTRQFTIGPAFQYAFSNYALLTLKVQWGVYDVNHGEGNNLWLKFWYPLMLF